MVSFKFGEIVYGDLKKFETTLNSKSVRSGLNSIRGGGEVAWQHFKSNLRRAFMESIHKKISKEQYGL